jgi:hypothetical protein
MLTRGIKLIAGFEVAGGLIGGLLALWFLGSSASRPAHYIIMMVFTRACWQTRLGSIDY